MKIGTTGWTQVNVPLATPGVADLMTDGFWVQNATGAVAAEVFRHGIRLE